MSCLQVYDFIIGTTITLPHGKAEAEAKGQKLDIVHPNADAAALVRDHLAWIHALQARRVAALRPLKISAIAC